MRMMVFRGGEAGGLNVAGDGFGRTFAEGSFVDFDEVAGYAVRDAGGVNEDGTPKQKRSKVTWGEAIGEAYAHLFKPVSEKKAEAVAEEVNAQFPKPKAPKAK